MTQCYSWPEQPNLQHCLSRLLWQLAHIPHNTEQQQLQVFHIDSCSVMSAVCSCPLPAPLLSLLVSDQCYWKSGGMTTNWAGQLPWCCHLNPLHHTSPAAELQTTPTICISSFTTSTSRLCGIPHIPYPFYTFANHLNLASLTLSQNYLTWGLATDNVLRGGCH